VYVFLLDADLAIQRRRYGQHRCQRLVIAWKKPTSPEAEALPVTPEMTATRGPSSTARSNSSASPARRSPWCRTAGDLPAASAYARRVVTCPGHAHDDRLDRGNLTTMLDGDAYRRGSHDLGHLPSGNLAGIHDGRPALSKPSPCGQPCAPARAYRSAIRASL